MSAAVVVVDDPETILQGLLSQAEGFVLTIQEALARVRGNTNFQVPGETTDVAAYRKHRSPNGPLSKLGEDVMLALLKLGLGDEAVGLRMNVSANGVAVRRRGWGRVYGQKG